MCLWIGRLRIVQISVLPKVIYKFSIVPIKILIMFNVGIKKKIPPKIHTESQGTLNTQSNLVIEEQSWRTWTFWFRNIPQSHTDQNSVVTNGKEQKTQKQAFTCMVNWFLTRLARPFNRKRRVFLTNDTGKNEYPHAKNEVGLLPYTKNKN